MRGFPEHVILLVLVAVLKYVVKYWDGFPNTPDLGMEKARKGCMGLASRVTAGTCRGKSGKSLWLLQRETTVCWANRKGRMGLWQEGRGQGKEEGAQPSFALGGTVSSVGEFPQHLLLPGSIFGR